MIKNEMSESTETTSTVIHQDEIAGFMDSEQSKPKGAQLPVFSEDVTKELVSVFKLLSDATRLKILLFLCRQNELHVRALCELLKQSQPAVSHHLALLRVAGLIGCRRDGKHNFYRLTSQYIGDLLNNVFSNVPAKDRHVRIENYILSYAPSE